MNMKERIARAIAEKINYGEDFIDCAQPELICERAATAALDALAEPTPEMVEAGGAVFGFGGDPESAERIFSAMIKTARGQ